MYVLSSWWKYKQLKIHKADEFVLAGKNGLGQQDTWRSRDEERKKIYRQNVLRATGQKELCELCEFVDKIRTESMYVSVQVAKEK